MNVLSLFDGMSCGRIALERAGIKVDNYFTSEIDKYASAVSEYNYPDLIRLGDVTKINISKLPKIDLLIGGFPCQSFSIAGNRKGFEDDRGNLFFDLMKIFKETKPKYFLFENVASMKKADREKLDSVVGVDSIMINSSLLSAQQRKRLYWTNIPNIIQPVDKGILLKDILEGNVDEKYTVSAKHTNAMIQCRKSKKLNIPDLNGKCGTIIASYYKIPMDAPFIQLHNTDEYTVRKLTPTECERLQTVPANFTEKGVLNGKEVNISNTQRYKMLGNGWTVDVIAHMFGGII